MMNPKCQRCPAEFDMRELLQEHSEYFHGDYMQARTKEEYRRFRKDRGGDLSLLEQIPDTKFLSKAKLRRWIQDKKAVPQ